MCHLERALSWWFYKRSIQSSNFHYFRKTGRKTKLLSDSYCFLEDELEERFPSPSTRPWVQYHGVTDEITLTSIHHRIKEPGNHPIKLFLATDKLLMGVDIQDIGLIIHIRPPNKFHTLEQACGRARGGKGLEYGSKKTVTVTLFNQEDLKPNVDGLSDEIRDYCRTNDCLKNTSANYFGYKWQQLVCTWCCINCEIKCNKLYINDVCLFCRL